jgi:hypothetical protein
MEPEIQDRSSLAVLEVLNPEFLYCPPLRKPAEFSGGINDDPASDVVHHETAL